MFSVIIPLYNKAHTIQETLTCVLQQSFQDFEIIIVDDGSTDNGVDIIKSAFNDDRIHIASQSNQGVSVARNTGIKHARGTWLSFLDADDIWDKDYLHNVNKAIAKFPKSDYILGGRRVMNISDGSSVNFIPSNLHGRVEIIDFFQNPHIFAHISASTISRSFLENSGIRFIPGQRFHEDFTFIFQIALKTSVCFIGLPLVTYCGGVSGQATSNLNTEIRLKDGILFRNTVMDSWMKGNMENKLFPIFMKYETRHAIMGYLKGSNYNELTVFIDNLSQSYKKKLFSNLELEFYKQSYTRSISIFMIKLLKLIWRTHRFPRVNV